MTCSLQSILAELKPILLSEHRNHLNKKYLRIDWNCVVCLVNSCTTFPSRPTVLIPVFYANKRTEISYMYKGEIIR